MAAILISVSGIPIVKTYLAINEESIYRISTTNDCHNYVNIKEAYSPRRLMIKPSAGLTKRILFII